MAIKADTTKRAAKKASSSTAKSGGGRHQVDNAGAPLDTRGGPAPAPTGETKAVQERAAAQTAKNLGPTIRTPELRHGVDPATGEELPVADALAAGTPVMKPESKGDMSDVTMPSHVQAPPVEQVEPGVLTKRNSSTSERRRAALAQSQS